MVKEIRVTSSFNTDYSREQLICAIVRIRKLDHIIDEMKKLGMIDEDVYERMRNERSTYYDIVKREVSIGLSIPEIISEANKVFSDEIEEEYSRSLGLTALFG